MKESNARDIDSLSFEDAIKELESIVSKLEGNSITLEESMNLYKRGVLLSHHCSKRIEKAQGEIRMLTRNQRGELEEIPFDIQEEGNE